MCSTTPKTKAASDALVKAVDIPDKVDIIPLKKYLVKEYKKALQANQLGAQPADDSAVNLHVPISIYALGIPGNPNYYAGIHDDEVHFSASLMKAAAMFAAFSLREEAKQLAAGGSFASPAAFFTALAAQFHTADADAAIVTAGVGLNPRYQDVLKVTIAGGVAQVQFDPVFANHLDLMIVPSNNNSAGECIRRLGYAYINVKLKNAGFYKPAITSGIWLAADFAGLTRVEIDSVNDGKSAQCTTSRQMGDLFAQIYAGKLINSTASLDMKNLLIKAETQGDASWLTHDGGNRKYNVVGVKVGLANLKPNTPPKGPDVYSEGVLLNWNGDPGDAAKLATLKLTPRIAVCWQNIRASAYGTGVPAIALMIENAFSNFIHQTPL